MARQGPGSPEVRPRRRSVCRGPAPGNRHRRTDRRASPGTFGRHRLLRRHRPREWQSCDDPDRRRLLGDVDASWFDERSARRHGRRGRECRHGRAQRRGRARRPIPPPRHPALRGPERLRRPAAVPPGAGRHAGSGARCSGHTWALAYGRSARARSDRLLARRERAGRLRRPCGFDDRGATAVCRSSRP